jgi:hypothetical protein
MFDEDPVSLKDTTGTSRTLDTLNCTLGTLSDAYCTLRALEDRKRLLLPTKDPNSAVRAVRGIWGLLLHRTADNFLEPGAK